MDHTILIVIGAIVFLLISTVGVLLSRYKKCPPNQILIKYGAGKNVAMETASVIEEIDADGKKDIKIIPTKVDTAVKVYQGKGALIWPVVQAYKTMKLTPLKITSEVVGPDNGYIDTHVDIALTTAVSGKKEIQLNAVSRFLGVEDDAIKSQIKMILDGTIRHVITTMSLEELNRERDQFLDLIKETLAPKLALIGYEILDINIQKIYDEVSYLDNLGKEKETQARNKALVGIAQKNKEGAVQKAQIDRDQATETAVAKKEQETQVKEAQKDQAIRIAQIERDQEVETSQANKEQAVKIAEIQRDQEIETATAKKLRESGVAQQESEERAQIASSIKDAEIAEARAAAESTAETAKAEASADAAKEEADAEREIRIAVARQKQAAETAQAVQDKEAREAEYKSQKDQRKAAAERDAGVAEQTAKIAVAEARAKAGQAEADADKIAETAKVEAKMSVEQTRQERQLSVNEAQAKAREAELNATQIVPAEMAKKETIIKADAVKQQKILDADGDAEATLRKAKADAEAIRLRKQAEAFGIQATKEAEAAGEEKMQLAKAKGVQQTELAEALKVERMIQAVQAAGGTVKDLTSLRLTDHVEVGYNAIAQQFEALRDAKVTVVGNSATAGDFISNLVNKGAPGLKYLQDGLIDQINDTFGLNIGGKRPQLPTKNEELLQSRDSKKGDPK